MKHTEMCILMNSHDTNFMKTTETKRKMKLNRYDKE